MSNLPPDDSKRNWWTTLPGILSSLGGLIAALTGLLVATGVLPLKPAPVISTTPPAATKLRGSWRVVETNVKDVGTIVWVGKAVLSSRGDSVALDLTKQSAGNRDATVCELKTHLEFPIGVAQSSTYTETVSDDCGSSLSRGQVQFESFSPNGGYFSGSFSRNDGDLLGTFEAYKK